MSKLWVSNYPARQGRSSTTTAHEFWLISYAIEVLLEKNPDIVLHALIEERDNHAISIVFDEVLPDGYLAGFAARIDRAGLSEKSDKQLYDEIQATIDEYRAQGKSTQ